MPLGLIILACFILLPTIEIYLFIEVGSVIGAIPTILLTVASAAAGTYMLRQQGLSLLMRMRSEMDSGRVPSHEMMHGAMIVFAGLMLLIPGFFTDAIGLLLFIPPLREVIGNYLARHVKVQNLNVNPGYRRRDGTVDLNEDEWSSSRHTEQDDDPSHPRSNDPDQISPWSSDDDKRR
ncbi:phage T7 F exclusion suppressor FxsA [Pseudovibrio sp. W64]|uniref:FxsA family protein n=1 Tax=unclassified Pseudovibrio TaxID=2627060 RepID=UPI00070F7C12|nr:MULTISPECIES: FxsA family protein [unclassified Pseudovibrio]KZK84430.1 phage T7 F exclusion suppressor FxsA [Pseudovibrio sp. W64]